MKVEEIGDKGPIPGWLARCPAGDVGGEIVRSHDFKGLKEGRLLWMMIISRRIIIIYAPK
jgi:hypothetical protein